MFVQPEQLPETFDHHFQFIRRADLDRELSTVFRHWSPSPLERAEFVGWAWVVASAADFVARTEDPYRAIDRLCDERDEVHRALAEELRKTANVELDLAARRMFLEWLRTEILAAARGVAAA